MNKFAVIDIGSNSVRLMLVANGKVLYKRLHTTRLGEGLAHSPYLKDEAIERTAAAVCAFAEQAKAEGAEQVFPFATAAVRTAQNGTAFVARVRELCALETEIVSGEKEAELGLFGALGTADGAVLDMGGASCEICIRRNGTIAYKKSVPLGVVRLKDECGRDKAKLTLATERAAKGYGEIPDLQTVCAIGGTATTLAALALGLREYDGEQITGTQLTRSAMQMLVDKLCALPVEEIAKLPCMPKGRADVITGGAVALATLMARLGIEKLIVSDRDNLEGYAIEKGLL
ncbi:MAG: hypothetical protein IJW60_02590 [Clostridia bacterium]|nr:hypothetical protein [Clostridia bacterium]